MRAIFLFIPCMESQRDIICNSVPSPVNRDLHHTYVICVSGAIPEFHGPSLSNRMAREMPVLSIPNTRCVPSLNPRRNKTHSFLNVINYVWSELQSVVWLNRTIDVNGFPDKQVYLWKLARIYFWYFVRHMLRIPHPNSIWCRTPQLRLSWNVWAPGTKIQKCFFPDHFILVQFHNLTIPSTMGPSHLFRPTRSVRR